MTLWAHTKSMKTQSECFQDDLDNMNEALHEMGAVREAADGFQWLDQSVVPAELLGTYNRLLQFGYANGYL